MSEKKKNYAKLRIDFAHHRKAKGLSLVANAIRAQGLLCGAHQSCIEVLSLRQLRSRLGREIVPGVPLTVDHVADAVAELEARGIVMWDPEEEVIWLIEGLDEQVGAVSPNWRTSVHRHVDSLPPSPVVDAFRDRYVDWFAGETAKGVPPTPPPNPSRRGSPQPLTPTPYPNHSPQPLTPSVQERWGDKSKSKSKDKSKGKDTRAPEGAANNHPPPPPSGQALTRGDVLLALNRGIGAEQDGWQWGPILESAHDRVERGEASLDDLEAVMARWREDTAKSRPAKRSLFYAKAWPSTARRYLDREVEAERPQERVEYDGAGQAWRVSKDPVTGKERRVAAS